MTRTIDESRFASRLDVLHSFDAYAGINLPKMMLLQLLNLRLRLYKCQESTLINHQARMLCQIHIVRDGKIGNTTDQSLSDFIMIARQVYVQAIDEVLRTNHFICGSGAFAPGWLTALPGVVRSRNG